MSCTKNINHELIQNANIWLKTNVCICLDNLKLYLLTFILMWYYKNFSMSVNFLMSSDTKDRLVQLSAIM